MFYKHWKKIALAVTSFFWVSCDNDPSSASEEPASSSSIEEIKSSAATGAPTSSSATETVESSATAGAPNSSSDVATQNSSSATEEAASSATQDDPNVNSSTSHKRSSSSEMIAPKYGVPMSSSEMVAPKYGVPMSSSEMVAPKYGVPMAFCERTGESTLVCDDGVTCTEEVTETQKVPECTGDQLCAKYGVVVVKETTYKCDNGKVYNYAEFQSKYTILDGAVDLYGCPSDICGPDPIDQAKPLYGI